jgi:hypothetical protein
MAAVEHVADPAIYAVVRVTEHERPLTYRSLLDRWDACRDFDRFVLGGGSGSTSGIRAGYGRRRIT